ncbi:MAG: translocation/assembly module TamB domain-containing protein [Bacteroidales bacterium]
MRKVIKKTANIFLIVALVLLLIPTALWLVIQTPRAQNYLVEQTTQILERKFGTKTSIGKFDFRLFNRILLKDVYAEDDNGDTLLLTKTISASIQGYNIRNNSLNFHRVTLNNAFINFETDTLGEMNLTKFIASFIQPKDTSRKSDNPITINAKNIRITESNFRMHKQNAKVLDHSINFEDMDVSALHLDVTNLSITGDTIAFTINSLKGIEKSGFVIDRFRTDMSFSSNHMDFERLRIQAMNSSISLPFLKFSYLSWKDMSDFLNQVKLNGEISNSQLSTKALSYFVPKVKNFDLIAQVECKFRGPVSELRVRELEIATAKNTFISSNVSLTGLPDFNNTLLFVDVKKFTTSVDDLESFTFVDSQKQILKLPDILDAIQRISFSGNFTGFISDFVAYGTLKTNIGDVSMDLLIKPDQQKATQFKGKVATEKLNLATLTNNDMFGEISMSATLNGNTNYKNTLNATTNATIYSIEANNYKYSNIKIDGTLNSKMFEGSLSVNDPNARVNFLGKVDFSDTIPTYDFSAFVPKLDLVKLNLNKVDSISKASFLLAAQFSGNTIDNIKGNIKIVNGFYQNQNGEIKTSDIVVSAKNTIDSKQITVKSEFIDGEIRGKYNFTNIVSSLQNLVYLYIPALSQNNVKPDITPTGVADPEFNDYIIRLRLNKTDKLSDVLFPSFRIAENSNVFGIYNPDFQTLNLKIKIPEIRLGNNIVKDILIDGTTNDATLTASITSPLVSFGNSNIRNISIQAMAQNDSLTTSIGWDNKTQVKNLGQLNTRTLFSHNSGNKTVNLHLIPSNFTLNDTIWNINESEIVIDSSTIFLNNILLYNKTQTLNVNGKIASLETDFIEATLKNIDVSNVNLYTQNIGYTFSGQINGYAKATNITSSPLFYADLKIDSLNVNDFELGQVALNSQWHPTDKRLSVDFINTHNKQGLSLGGDYFPETEKLQFFARLNSIALGLLEPLMAGEVTNLEGSTSGNISISGTSKKPLLNGTLRINNAAATVEFSKTRYFITDQVTVDNSDVIFQDFKIQDSNKRLAVLNGKIKTNYFKNILLDLNLAPSNFQLLNTNEHDNELFYGTVYASGQVKATGPPKNITVNASIKTEPRTAIYLPLSSSSSVAEYDFVQFLNKTEEIFIVEEQTQFSKAERPNINLMLDLEVTPDADVQIIIDKQLGDIIKANGSGNLKMEIDLNKNIFNMFGQYVIEQGDYLFTLQGVINKRFKIGQGGTLTWNGDIIDALMDIQAIYSLRTSLKNLNPGSDDPIYKNRTQVDCEINLSGKLMEPKIGFGIKVPLAENDPIAKAVVQDALNTEERVSRQFLSLLVIQSFTSEDPTSQNAIVGQGLASTAGEMLSNQFSNLLSQITTAFDFGVNWRPGDELSSSEIEFALSTQLFNDRLSINSNLDMGNQNVSSGFVGDVSADLKIVPSGKLRLKAFYRSNDELMYGTNYGDYTAGAGLMYREDFNSLEELFAKYKNYFIRKKKNEYDFNLQNTDNEANKKPTPPPDETKLKIDFVEIK